MADPVRLTIVPNEAAAELACSFLRAEGIRCGHRPTDVGVGAGGGLPTGGPREVLVDPSDLAAARQVLAAADRGEFTAS
jgi:hypothetical protein